MRSPRRRRHPLLCIAVSTRRRQVCIWVTWFRYSLFVDSKLCGHKPLALVGGATGLIGDPKQSGERTLNSREVVSDWVDRIREQLTKFYSFEGVNAAQVVNNLDWTADMGVLEFMRDIGKHFSVNRMLDREAVAARLAKDGISFTEFSYQLLQSYDYLQLFKRYSCVLQTGVPINGEISRLV